MRTSTIASTTIATAAVAILTLGAPLAASAHVHIVPEQAPVGSYATVTFTVPNESATAGTVKVEVDLPSATPFSSVSYLPVPGWTAEVVTGTLPKPVTTATGTDTTAPLQVVWTADAGVQIVSGQFQQFTIRAGAVPDTGSVLLPVHQTYSDGTVVDWAEATPASGDEPEHPAPVLYITTAPPVDEDSAVSAVGVVQPSSGDSPVAIGLGAGGVVVAFVALVFAVLAFQRGRRPAAE